MAPQYDQAYEELKREDFLNKIKSLVPFIVSCVFLILLATGLYTWHDARYEKQLYAAEKEFDALRADKEKRSPQAINALKKLSGMRFITNITFSPETVLGDAVVDPYKSYVSLSVRDFLSVNRSLWELASPSKNKNTKAIEQFNGLISVWHPFAASYEAFAKVINHYPKKAFHDFSFLSKTGKMESKDTVFLKLASLCKIGLYDDTL